MSFNDKTINALFQELITIKLAANNINFLLTPLIELYAKQQAKLLEAEVILREVSEIKDTIIGKKTVQKFKPAYDARSYFSKYSEDK